MMKKLLLLSSLFCVLTSYSQQYTQILDVNFEQALIDLGIDSDGLVNGQVLTSDISGVTSLDVQYKNIGDLTGIGDFAALTNLNCNDNELTSLDLSQNLELTDLYLNIIDSWQV